MVTIKKCFKIVKPMPLPLDPPMLDLHEGICPGTLHYHEGLCP